MRPWFRAVKYHGPIQVTAARRGGRWHVLEYNIRIGVTSGAMLLRMLANPTETLLRTGRNQKLQPRFNRGMKFGCSITLAGYGYPYVQLLGPPLPVETTGPLDKGCDLWWNEVARGEDGRLVTTGHRIADVIRFRRVARRRHQNGLRKHSQNPQPGQLLSDGHWPDALAAGTCLKS